MHCEEWRIASYAVAVLAGLLYALAQPGFESIYAAVSAFAMGALAGYIVVMLYRQTLGRLLARTILKVRSEQVRLAVKHGCGLELTHEEAEEIAQRISAELQGKRRAKARRAGASGEQ